jgi:hypothetical protein
LPLEAHGFNSIDAWPQLLLKGVRWLKIDVALATRASCEAFSTFGLPGRGNASDCFSDGGAEYCCIAFSGDTGSRPFLLDPFNTSYDLLAMLGDPASAAWLPAPGTRPLRLGLDAGGSPGGCLSGCAAAPLFRAFLLAWGALVARGVNVLGSNDNGFAGWFQNLDEMCAGGGCSGDDAALAALPWVSQAGASWGGVPAGAAGARFQVVNEDYTSFQRCCSSDCWAPAVSPSAQFPWLWYEQTGQADYVDFLQAWQGCAALPASRRADPQRQLLLVSNMAPETMQVYSAPAGVVAGGVNAPAAGGGGLRAPLLAAAAGASGAWAVAAAARADGGVGVWVFPAAPGAAPGGSFSEQPSAELPPGGGALVALAWASVVGEDEAAAPPPRTRLLLAARESGALVLWAFDSGSGALTAVGNWSAAAAALAPGASLLAGALVCSAPLPAPLPPLAALPCAAALVATGRGGAGAVAALVAPLGAAGALAASAPLLVGPAARVDRGAALVLAWGGAGGIWEGVAVASASANNSGWPAPGGAGSRAYLYGAAVSLLWEAGGSGALSVSPPPPAGGAYPPRIGLGSTPRAAGTRFNGTTGALLLTTDGVCDAALYTNNADMWRCGLAKPSFDGNLFYSAFQTVPGMLQYDAGTLSAWRSLVTSGGSEHLSICSRGIAHGKLEAAASGSGALLPWVVAREGGAPRAELAVLVAHEAARPSAPQWLLCGLPTEKSGLVWDSWDLLQFGALDA